MAAETFLPDVSDFRSSAGEGEGQGKGRQVGAIIPWPEGPCKRNFPRECTEKTWKLPECKALIRMVEKNKQNQGFVDSDRQCNHQKLNKFTEQGYYFHEWYPFSVVFRSHISEAWHKPQAQKKRHWRRSANGRKAETASESNRRWQDYFLYCQTWIPCRGYV